MRSRQLATVAAAALTVLLVAAPAESQAPRLVTIIASDNAFRTDSGGTPNVTIAAGGHVNFAYPFGSSRHNVKFTGALPTVCGSEGGPAATASALPGAPAGPGWDGGCDFQTVGSYPYICELHPNSMTGSVTVIAAGASPPVEVDDPAARSVRVALHQRGTSVRGSVLVAHNGSRVLARAYARRKSLYVRSRSSREVRVGRRLRSTVRAGRATFSAPLNALARSALRRNGRMLLKLRLTVTPPEGRSYTATRTVILRPR